MCDGVTQGRPGMELSLFSRDVIALSTAVALTHDAFDAALMLGTCDKIVPGLMIGALSFGHLPILFSPAGPMPSGIPNKEKAKVRELFALGQVTREELLDGRGRVLSHRRHLHLLRHRQFQPDDDGADGRPPARHGLRQSRHASSRGPAARRRLTLHRAGEIRRPAAGAHHRRTRDRQCTGRPDGDRRIDQPRPAHSGDGGGGGHHRRLG